MRRLKTLSTLLIVFMISVLLVYPAMAWTADPVAERVRAIVNRSYVDTVPPSVQEAASVAGILQALGDPYADYFTPEEFKQFQDNLDQTFVGIGVVFDPCPQGALVRSILSRSPAETAGLKTGDIIQSVDGVSLAHQDIEAIGKALRGPEGSRAALAVQRKNDLLQVSVTRRVISLPSVSSRLLAGRIGYIQISVFASDTGQLFGEAANRLQDQGARSWIIDLRDNGGGYLEAARLIAGYFIPGQTCLLTDSRFVSSYPLAAGHPELYLSGPAAILVNEQTASASEVLAGALQDYGKAVVIGRQTFGKGCVQWLFDLDTDGILKLTCEKYRTPLGHQVNNVGITPDLATDMDSLKMAELMLSGQSLSTGQKKSLIVLRGRTYPIDLTLANSPDYKEIYLEMLRVTTAPQKVAGASAW